MMTVLQSTFSVGGAVFVLLSLMGTVPLVALNGHNTIRRIGLFYFALVFGAGVTFYSSAVEMVSLQSLGVLGGGTFSLIFAYAGMQRIKDLERRVHEQGEVMIDAR